MTDTTFEETVLRIVSETDLFFGEEKNYLIDLVERDIELKEF